LFVLVLSPPLNVLFSLLVAVQLRSVPPGRKALPVLPGFITGDETLH
jgi:hypothetical protein